MVRDSRRKALLHRFRGAEVARKNARRPMTEAAALWAKVGAPKDRIIAIPG